MNAEGRIGFWSRSIKTKIGITLFVIIIGVLGLFGVYRYMDNKSTITKELDELSSRTILRLAEQLILPLWEVNNLWVRKIIISEMSDERIYAISVVGEGNIYAGMKRDTDWQLIDANDDISGDYILETKDIVRGKRKIGSVRIYITKRFMVSELRRDAMELFVTVIVFGVFCIFVLLGMLHKIVIYPINRILRIADAIANGEYDQEILIDQQDEIGILGRGFNSMQKQIRQRELELLKYHEHLEELVRGRTAQLEAANKEMHAFTYTVSHDLRAPLRHVDGFMELLQKRTGSTLDEQSQHYMDAISDAAQKMGLLIDNLLAFSRMGYDAMFFQAVDLGTIVREVIQELELDTAGRNIEWRIGDLPLVNGDASLLRMVMTNLIANAVKYTRPREQAEIEIGSNSGQASETVIYVRDNGVGFDMTYVDKLFGVFQRLHRSEEFEGTGIGLANVRRIINRHGGRTWAEGKLDQGATFYFALPCVEQGGGD